MKKIFEIIRYELTTALSRKSYVFLAFGLPVLAVLFFTGFTLFRSTRSAGETSGAEQESFQFEIEGYIDQAGIITDLPEDIPDQTLVPYSDEQAANLALEREEISAYYIIPNDYVSSGNLIYVHPDVNPIAEGGQNWVMIKTLYYNLLDRDDQLIADVWMPAIFDYRELSNITQSDAQSNGDCTTPGYGCESNALIQFLPIGIMAILYISIITGGSYVLRLVSSEKDSRIMEILLLSASPKELLTGKVLSYCLLGFFQVLAWLGAVYLVFRIGGSTLNLPAGFSLPASLIAWGLVFFVLGFILYAVIMAGAGALTPKLSQYTSVYFIVSAPLLISYLLSFILAMNPHSLLAVALSIFPLSAPIMMITRLTVGGVPTWQPLAAVGLTIIMAVLIIRAVARMFRAQVLLSGQPFSVRRFVNVLLNS